MRLKDVAEGVKDLYMLDPHKITEEPGWNARVEGADLAAHVRQLANSIKEIGIQEPLTVYVKNDAIILTNGHCRLAAVMLAIAEGSEIKAIPCRVEERYSSESDRVLSLITRNSGKPLTPLEMSSVFKRLLAFGWNPFDIAKKAGFSTTYVINLLTLSGAPDEIKEQVASGSVSASLATEVMQQHGENAAEVISKGIETAKAEGKEKATRKHIDPKPKATRPVDGMQPDIDRAVKLLQLGADMIAAAALVITLPRTMYDGSDHSATVLMDDMRLAADRLGRK